jgi:MFS family permease
VSDFAGYKGQSYAEYLAVAPAYAEMYIITKKLVGAMIAVSSILMILVNHYSYRKGERWSWYALLVAGALLWGTLIGYRFLIGYLVPSIVTFVVGAALWIVGITLPARDILSLESEDKATP